MNITILFLLVVVSIAIAELARVPGAFGRAVGYSFLRGAVTFVALTLTGCADTELRMTEYTGKAKPGMVGLPYVSGDLAVNGCRIVQSEPPLKGCATLTGKGGCVFVSTGCKDKQTGAPGAPSGSTE